MTQVRHSPSRASADKLLGTAARKLRLALVAAALLIVGAVLAPATAPRALSIPNERPAPLLEAEILRREPPSDFSAVPEVAARVGAFGVAVPRGLPSAVPIARDHAAPPGPALTPAGFGVVVSGDGDVLTHAGALAGRFTVHLHTAGHISTQAQVLAFESTTGLVLLRLSPGVPAAAAPTTDNAPPAGALAVAVARWLNGELATPVVVSGVNKGVFSVRPVGAALPPGTPLYTTTGALFAIAGEGDQAYPARAAVERLTARALANQGHEPALGVSVQPLDGLLAQAFGERGVLVASLVAGGPASAAGVEPGDVIRRINEDAIDSPESLLRHVAALQRGAQIGLLVFRGGKERGFTATVGTAFEVAARMRQRRDAPLSPPRADALFPAPQLEAAQVSVDALVLGVNGRAVASRAEVARELRRGTGPLVLYLEHEGERFFTPLPRLP
ncbi:MAG: S1C family serine protease [Acidobacteriota bacterium]